MTSGDFRALVGAMAAAIAENADHLTDLDSAIGDGDHGANMKRGFQAVLGELDQLVANPVPNAIKAAGMKLVMTVGGASGPLVGTFFMTLGKELPADFDRDALVTAYEKAVDAVAARGKSQAGQKTMLDVLYPILDAAKHGADLNQIAARAKAAAEATIPMLATRGRASFLGERSIGHMDPGAASVALLAGVVARTLPTHEGA
ncbi:MAG: dihydroxyacetone kinase subunit L [Hoeflea sp.]|uniref:dihydroxyacetone kinase subunit DhaL n=1 Tax=Hoeflea sp. TaxID=1940281 RepID=UPI001D94F2D9|nr:dihydroxyacetone kinase subunit DhaL [Hoeflea sp.]MBU4528141.1 dihydroxyacetone kinase subunit L [Alphaproteobacteria bacterium]MBU4543737.1 dihydroxyacetone kinase subunit L [Alphaproteobacteria bacterium]MBU4548604.1 dihydroxyacetone kinase subunit L [Alphaproteobacteria bacterium]MBV1725770.1 dihydroxyacetone kinase subunit L [Hoeflea sp.]MBV1762126.1 dihydroxyacetone kinase subunit L [Hoeflea sp.]